MDFLVELIREVRMAKDNKILLLITFSLIIRDNIILGNSIKILRVSLINDNRIKLNKDKIVLINNHDKDKLNRLNKISRLIPILNKPNKIIINKLNRHRLTNRI